MSKNGTTIKIRRARVRHHRVEAYCHMTHECYEHERATRVTVAMMMMKKPRAAGTLETVGSLRRFRRIRS